MSSKDLGMIQTNDGGEDGTRVSRPTPLISRRLRVSVLVILLGLSVAVSVAVLVMIVGEEQVHESMEGMRLPLERITETPVAEVPAVKATADPDTRVFDVTVREPDTGEGGESTAREIVVLERPALPEPDGSAEWFSVNVASCKKRAYAESLADTLRKKGYAPSVVEVTLQERGKWYRVSLGRFPSEEEAWGLARAFYEEEGIECFVTTAE